jgi:hypothetical protein
MTFAQVPDSLTIHVWTSTRRPSPRGRPLVSAQGAVDGTSDPSHPMARAALLMTSPRRPLSSRPNISNRRLAAADRQAADQSTMTAMADDRTAMATMRATS